MSSPTSESTLTNVANELERLVRADIADLIKRVSNGKDLDPIFNVIADTMTPSEAAATLASGLRQKEDFNATLIYMDTLFSKLAETCARAREKGQPISEVDQQAVQALFEVIREQCTRPENDNAFISKEYLVTGLEEFLTKNPEFKTHAEGLRSFLNQGLIENLVSGLSTISPATQVTELREIVESSALWSVNYAVSRYQFLQRIVRKLTPEQKEKIEQSLIISGKNNANLTRQLDALQSLFNTSESNELNRNLQRNGLRLVDLPDLLNDQLILDIIEIMSQYPEDFRFQLGALLTQIPAEKLPKHLLKRLQPTLIDSEISLKAEHGGWFLCSTSEPRLLDAMGDHALMLVNGNLLLKFNGKFSALCLNTFTTNGAIFVEGNWYSPSDEASKQFLRDTFDNGLAKVALQQGEWILMRPVQGDKRKNKSAQEIIDKAKAYVLRMQDTLPDRIRNRTRQEYRNLKREEL